jgi:hypothetical protein
MDAKPEFDDYDTAINVIGALKDCSIVFNVIESHFSDSTLANRLTNQLDEFHYRTEKSRTRIVQEINKTFLRFESKNHQDLIQGIFENNVPLRDKELVLVWQFALNNRLFRDISLKVFCKTYYSGRTSISKEDITAYLKEFLSQNSAIKTKWSESTVSTLSTKYLNLLTKLEFLSAGRTKLFKHIRPSSEAQVLFLYFAKLHDLKQTNLLMNELLPLSFVPSEDCLERLKKLSIKGLFEMSFNGVALSTELTHSYRGISDVLYRS